MEREKENGEWIVIYDDLSMGPMSLLRAHDEITRLHTHENVALEDITLAKRHTFTFTK